MAVLPPPDLPSTSGSRMLTSLFFLSVKPLSLAPDLGGFGGQYIKPASEGEGVQSMKHILEECRWGSEGRREYEKGSEEGEKMCNLLYKREGGRLGL